MLEEMNDFFESRLDIYDNHMLTNIDSAKEFYTQTAKFLPSSPNCRVLDLGCGTGLELEEYFRINPKACITAIDLSQKMLDECRLKFPENNIKFICGSYFDINFDDNSFDAIVSVESLHHFTAEKKLVLYSKLKSSLKTNGCFILTDYFAISDEEEKHNFEEFENLKIKQNLKNDCFYHYDTPLTVDHEIDILKQVGFSSVKIVENWGQTFLIKSEL